MKVICDFASWEILHTILLFAEFFSNLIISKHLSGMPTKCQTVWLQIKPNVLLDLLSGFKLFANFISR